MRNFKVNADETWWLARFTTLMGEISSVLNDMGAPSFCLWGFFSGPFLPFSIVLGAASPGEASSNGGGYIATITAPACSFRPQLRATFLLHLPGRSGTSVKLKDVLFLGFFWKKDYSGAIIAPSLLRLTLCSSPRWPPMWQKRSPRSRRVAEISELQIRNANYVLSRQRGQ